MKVRQITFEGVNNKLKVITTSTIAQLKYDGSSYHLHIKNGKAYALTSKRVSVKTNLLSEKLDNFPKLKQRSFPFKKETIVVVEASAEHLSYVEPNKRCGFVAGTCNSLPEKVQDNEVVFIAHSFIMHEGENVQHLTNKAQQQIVKKYFPKAGPFAERINIKKDVIWSVTNIDIDRLLERYRKDSVQDIVNMKEFKYEGFVLKDLDSKAMLKVKKQLTADCIIVGYVPGTKKYTGQVGSLTVAVFTKKIPKRLQRLNRIPTLADINHLLVEHNLIEVGTVSGMTDYLREEFTNYFDEKYLGSIIECEYMEWTGKRMRHPRFNRIREDKQLKRCIIEQLI